MSDTTPTSETPTATSAVGARPSFAPVPSAGSVPDGTDVLLPTAPPSTPALLLDTDDAAPAGGQRRWVKWTVRSLVAASIAGLAALSAYLWVVNGDWVSQNEQLRAEALELGETLANERAEAALQAEELALVGTQLENATTRISDLANEEANAIDDRNILENLVENYQFCSDQRQSIIDVLTNSSLYFPGSSAAQVERETTRACDEVNANFKTYLDDRASR